MPSLHPSANIHALHSFPTRRSSDLGIDILPKQKTIIIGKINYKHNPSFSFRSTFFINNADTAYNNWHKTNYFFEGYHSNAHSFHWLLPANKYFQKHPEYFALIDGKRNPSQPCLSHPAVYNIMLANLRKEIAAYPHINIWSVSQNDGYNYCHCNICEAVYKKEGGYMGVLLPFVNKFAIAFPNKTISTLAFLFSDEPPKTIKPERNVEIVYCTWNTSRKIPISKSKDERSQQVRRQLKEWKKLTDNILVWDYISNFVHSLYPFPNLQTIQPNLEYYRSLQIERMFQQGIGYMQGEFSELKGYLVCKLLWDINIDREKLTEDFVNHYYGPASPYILSYLKSLEKEVLKDEEDLKMTSHALLHKDGYLSSSNRAHYHQLFSKAEAATKNTIYYERVVQERLALDYADINIAAYTRNTSINSFNKKIESFIQDAKKYGIHFLNEARDTPAKKMEMFKNARK